MWVVVFEIVEFVENCFFIWLVRELGKEKKMFLVSNGRGGFGV